MKLRHRAVTPPQIRFGREVEAIFAQLPRTGPLFPYLRTVREADRATEFKQRCQGLEISGSDAAQLSLCLGRARQDLWLPRTVRANGARPQQQGRPSRLCPESAGHGSGLGRLRERIRGEQGRAVLADGSTCPCAGRTCLLINGGPKPLLRRLGQELVAKARLLTGEHAASRVR
jgi:hypothetical protein